ncbi:MAG TPA: hypothetical protein VFF69_09525, partial [Phycisphaerales bacterium]|nr:hypothetical protein [Phycisphaerales bacterium]
DRETLIGALREGLARAECVRAAWLGGSDATRRADAVSDVDLMLVAAAGRVEDAVAAIDAAIAPVARVRLRYRLPQPTWHGFEQAFYQFEDAPEWLMLDWLVIEQGRAHQWLEVERHGAARVLLDRDGEIAEAHVDRAAIAAAVRKRVEDVRVKHALFRHLAPKMAERGLPADAAYFYHSIMLRSLVDLVRAVHCPERHDYGFRYLERDLPPELYARVCRLCYPAGGAEIPAMAEEADAIIAETLAGWDAQRRG